jgi:hypothetical protein
MLKKKSSKLTNSILFLSVLVVFNITSELVFNKPVTDVYFLLKNIIVLIISLVISGAIIAYLPKNTIGYIILANITIVLFYLLA